MIHKMEKIFLYLCSIVVLFFTGCYDNILDKKPLNNYTDAIVWSNPDLMEAFLATQYMYTPVMIQDATTMFTSWSGSPLNRDARSGDSDYFFGNSEQVFGVGLTMELTDETKYTLGSWAHLEWTKAHGITADGGVLEWWENAYYTIRNLNTFISKAADSPLNQELIQTRIAEARFLRAYCYFAMVKRYGGVPLLTVVPDVDSSDEILFPKRNSEKELWDFIIRETSEIVEILPSPENTDYGRVHKYAALALNCRAALYAGSIAQFGQEQLDGLLGMPRNEANTYYQTAYSSAKKIMDEGPYDLYDVDADKVQNFKNIFLRKRNVEAILVKQHDGPSFQNGGFVTWSWDQIECPRPQVWGIGNAHAPYLELVEEFEYVDGRPGTFDRNELENGLWTMEELWKDRDPRFYASIWTNGMEWREAIGGQIFGPNRIDMHNGIIKPDGTLITGLNQQYENIPAAGDQMNLFLTWNEISTGFGIMKYLDPSANNMEWLCESRTDYQIFRFAEILLNFAEAAFELNKSDDALTAVNRIRERAGIRTLTAVDREKIRHERKVELAFENHRYWDLRRWREAETKLTRSFSGIQYIYDFASQKFKIKVIDDVDGRGAPPTFPAHNYYFPVTKGRTGVNKNLIENPGY
jgi:hypothetical protein